MNSKSIKFVLIGATGTGKTMFLSCIQEGTGRKIVPLGDATTKYITDNWNILNEKDDKGKRKCKLSPNEGTFFSLHFMYQNDDFGKVQFSTHDYDGNFTEKINVNTTKSEVELNNKIKQLESDIYSEVFSKDDATKETLKDELEECKEERKAVLTKKQREQLLQSVQEKPKGIFFFLPYEETTERFQSFAQNVGKFIELAQFSDKSKSPIPACIVVTKWDASPNVKKGNEEEYAREYLNSNEYLQSVLNIVENYFEYVKVIPVSACESYNLTGPFDFALEKTFEQWYTRAVQLKEEKKFKQLIAYLATRYDDVKFVKTHDFNALYEEVQDEYIKIVEKEFYAFTSYDERKNYLEEQSPLFKTKKELLQSLEKALKGELRQIKFKRVRNRTLSFIAIGAIGVGLLEYKMKLDVDELYLSIKQQYAQNMLYPLMEQDIQKFLQDYKNVNFLYALANVPEKRAEVIKIRDNSKVKYKEWIDTQISSILTNKKLSADEKRLKLKELRAQADSLDRSKIDQIMMNLGLSINNEKWLAAAKDCLKTCEGELGVRTIIALIDRVEDGSIVMDNKIKMFLNKLSEKKSMIIQMVKQKEVLAKIKEQQDANNLMAYLSGLPSNIKQLPDVKEKILVQYISFLNEKDIGEILSWFSVSGSSSLVSRNNKIVSQGAIPQDVVASERFRNALVFTLEEKYGEALRGSGMIDAIKENSKIGEVQKILAEIKSRLDNNTMFDTLLKSIDDATIGNLKDTNFEKFKGLTDKQQDGIRKQISKKITKYITDLIESIPEDTAETKQISQIIEEIETMDGFSLKEIDYSYAIPENIEIRVGNLKAENEKIKDLIANGLDNIKVTLTDKDADKIGFECDGWMDNTDYNIKGFGNELIGENDLCNKSGKLTYKNKITLNSETKNPKRYNLEIFEDGNGFYNGKKEYIFISIEDLIRLRNGEIVRKPLENSGLELEFIHDEN